MCVRECESVCMEFPIDQYFLSTLWYAWQISIACFQTFSSIGASGFFHSAFIGNGSRWYECIVCVCVCRWICVRMISWMLASMYSSHTNIIDKIDILQLYIHQFTKCIVSYARGNKQQMDVVWIFSQIDWNQYKWYFPISEEMRAVNFIISWSFT